MANATKAERPAVNYVHKNAILVETVRKENESSKLYTNYSVNPYKKIHILTEKPNTEDAEEDADYHFLQVIQRANLEPTKKHITPQTESQEVGWITRPLIDVDRSDRRLYFPRNSCEITKFMDAFWKNKEQKPRSGAAVPPK